MFDVGNVTVVSMRFLLVLGVLVAGCWVRLGYRLTHRRGRAGGRWRAWLTGSVAALLTVVLAADCVNSYYSYLPNVSDVTDAITQTPPPGLNTVLSAHRLRPPRHGALVSVAVPDSGTGFGTTGAWVWLPPQYFTQPSRRLPVVYLFHGSPGVPKDWFHAAQAQRIGQRLADQGLPVIEVAPALSRSWLDDSECVDGAHQKVETHLLRDVIPAVDRSLRTIPNRTGRIFAGMSAGGYCALNLGLRNRDVAATILDLSGYTGPTHDGGMTALFGPDPTPLAVGNSPASYAARLTTGPTVGIWLDCGRADHEVLRQMDRIAPILRADHMTVVQRTRPGDHTYSTWRPALDQSLTWALQQPIINT